MKPRLKGPILYPGGFAQASATQHGWIVDIWVLNLTTNLPYMTRTVSEHSDYIDRDVHRAIKKLLTDAIAGT